MKRLLSIARLLLLLALVGAGPSWAESCCCGTGASLCAMPEDVPGQSSVVEAAQISWQQTWGMVAERALLCRTDQFAESSACRPATELRESCTCWEPGESGRPVAPAVPSELFHQPGPVAMATALPKPKARIVETRWVKLPPQRPPIDHIGWAYALFPLPPPF